jgi:hypothetical protein
MAFELKRLQEFYVENFANFTAFLFQQIQMPNFGSINAFIRLRTMISLDPKAIFGIAFFFRL